MKNTLTSCTVTIENIDLTELKKQKTLLIDTMAKNNLMGGDLEGILNLIDYIQDKAIEENGFKEEDIFNLPSEEDHEKLMKTLKGDI